MNKSVQLSLYIMPISNRRQGQDKTVLSCSCRRCKQNWPQVKTVSVTLNIFETEQLQIGNWVETRPKCLVLSLIQFTPPTRTRRFCLVRVGGVK